MEGKQPLPVRSGGTVGARWVPTLVVEDDALVAEVHASYVERVPGFTVAGVAHRATEALAILASRPIDLVLSAWRSACRRSPYATP
jgi:hypothetical protein